MNFYYLFLQVLYMHIVIMYNNIYYNLTYIATASAPYIYGPEKIPNEHEYTKHGVNREVSAKHIIVFTTPLY